MKRGTTKDGKKSESMCGKQISGEILMQDWYTVEGKQEPEGRLNILITCTRVVYSHPTPNSARVESGFRGKGKGEAAVSTVIAVHSGGSRG